MHARVSTIQELATTTVNNRSKPFIKKLGHLSGSGEVERAAVTHLLAQRGGGRV